jgi:hypothetical protein
MLDWIKEYNIKRFLDCTYGRMYFTGYELLSPEQVKEDVIYQEITMQTFAFSLPFEKIEDNIYDIEEVKKLVEMDSLLHFLNISPSAFHKPERQETLWFPLESENVPKHIEKLEERIEKINSTVYCVVRKPWKEGNDFNRDIRSYFMRLAFWS